MYFILTVLFLKCLLRNLPKVPAQDGVDGLLVGVQTNFPAITIHKITDSHSVAIETVNLPNDPADVSVGRYRKIEQGCGTCGRGPFSSTAVYCKC